MAETCIAGEIGTHIRRRCVTDQLGVRPGVVLEGLLLSLGFPGGF